MSCSWSQTFLSLVYITLLRTLLLTSLLNAALDHTMSLLSNSARGATTSMSRSTMTLILFLTLQATPSQAQGWWGNTHGNNNPWNGGSGSGGDNGSNPFGSDSQFSPYSASSRSKALIAHAVIASLIWAFLVPVGGILLRLNLNSPWILRIHAFLQITSFVAYIAAVALGVHLIQSFSYGPFSLWDNPHPQLGLAILALACFQPILGYVHHRVFKKRQAAARAGKAGKAPGRTAPGYLHLWLGRSLIVLGIINGGLGIRLASAMQSAATTRKASIGYGVGAGLMSLIYLFFVVTFEARRRRARATTGTARGNVVMTSDQNGHGETPPTYTESEESVYHPEAGRAPPYQQMQQAPRYS